MPRPFVKGRARTDCRDSPLFLSTMWQHHSQGTESGLDLSGKLRHAQKFEMDENDKLAGFSFLLRSETAKAMPVDPLEFDEYSTCCVKKKHHKD